MFALYKFELRKINSRKIVWITGCVMPVSYTHLDVYKRQCYTGSQTYFTPKGKEVIRMKFQKKCGEELLSKMAR